MPDFSLKLPNLTAEISWSFRISDSIGDVEDIDVLVKEKGKYKQVRLLCCGEYEVYIVMHISANLTSHR